MFLPTSCRIRSQNESKIKWTYFAVTAPWGIEFNQCVFAVVGYNVIKVLGYSNCDWSAVVAWDWLWFQVWFQFAGFQVAQELFQGFNSVKKLVTIMLGNFPSIGNNDLLTRILLSKWISGCVRHGQEQLAYHRCNRNRIRSIRVGIHLCCW